MNLKISFYLLIFIVFISCKDERKCTNRNPIFDQFSPSDEKYKEELAKQLRRIENKNLFFWFETYLKKDNKEFILVHVNGDDLCAIAEIQVIDWHKISGLDHTRGGFRGAELRGLQIDIQKNNEGTQLIYKDIEEIID